MNTGWHVEQQAKSRLGNLQWLRVAGPYRTHAEADSAAWRRETRTGLPTRIVEVK